MVYSSLISLIRTREINAFAQESQVTQLVGTRPLATTRHNYFCLLFPRFSVFLYVTSFIHTDILRCGIFKHLIEKIL